MNLFERLARAHPGQSAAHIAALLGLTRQAYAQARARGRLSQSAALRAAQLLNLDPGAALLANAPRQHPPPPINHPTPNPRPHPTNDAGNAHSGMIMRSNHATPTQGGYPSSFCA